MTNSYEDIFWNLSLNVVDVYEFQRKAKSYEGISWVSVWCYLSLRALNKGDFFWRHLLSLSFKLRKFMSFKQKRILMNKFFESQFELMNVLEFQAMANSYEDICWASVWIWCMFMNFKEKQNLMKAFLESQFEVI